MKTGKQIISVTLLSVLLFIGCQDAKKESAEVSNDDTVEQIDKSETPQAVKDAFRSQYPGENDPDWEIDSNGNWESSFKIDGVHFRADYAPDGSWIETETSIDKDDLPKAIKDIIDEQYAKEEITEVERVNHHSKGMFYDVEFKQKGKNKDVEFRENGAILAK